MKNPFMNLMLCKPIQNAHKKELEEKYPLCLHSSVLKTQGLLKILVLGEIYLLMSCKLEKPTMPKVIIQALVIPFSCPPELVNKSYCWRCHTSSLQDKEIKLEWRQNVHPYLIAAV